MARLIQAGMDFATEGERHAAEELKKLPEGWVVIANKILPAARNRSLETDFIVIGDHRVFVIDEKSWTGRIHGSETIWVRDTGASESSPLNKIDFVAKVLAGYLRRQVVGFADLAGHPVIGCVLLSRTDERPFIRDQRARDGLLYLSTAVDTIIALDEMEPDRNVATLRTRIERALVDLSDRPQVPREIGPYEVLERIQTRTDARVFRARHDEGGERILTVYNSPRDDERLHNFYLQEYRALRDLSESGVAPVVFDSFSWSEDFLVIPSEVPDGRPLGAFGKPRDEADVQEELARAVAAFRSLAKVHQAGIVHRALGPETIFVTGTPTEPHVIFTNFYAARRGTETISHFLDQRTTDDAYAAPEIAALGSYEFASTESDVYTLGLIFLERLTNESVSTLRDDDGQIQMPPLSTAWPYIPEEIARELAVILEQTVAPGPMARVGSVGAARIDAATAADRLLDVQRRWTADIAISQGEMLDGRYRVERVLGQGASTRTFLVFDTFVEDVFAAKQMLRPTQRAEFDQLVREYKILREHPHASLPRVVDVYDPQNSVHAKLEYIDGPLLSEDLPAFHRNLDRWRQLANDLLDALEHLEKYEILHRDIKPDNIIIESATGRAVLIDLGSATTAGQTVGFAGTPGYSPPEAYSDSVPDASTDCYAVGVVLFQALTGRLPFADESLEQRPLEDISWLRPEHQAVARALLKAVDRDPARRYRSAAEMRRALLTPQPVAPVPDPTLTERINPWVNNLRGLFRNSRLGNADNRGLDTDFARMTYVPTALDLRLLPAVLETRPHAVFLTGNPGDGKTAFLARVELALAEKGARQIEHDAAGWIYDLDGHIFRACYDASEAHAGLSADDQLRQKLAGLEGDEAPNARVTVLVAINDGRLADIVETYQDFGWLTRHIERALVETAPLGAEGIWIVDLKRRAYVSLRPDADDRSVMRQVLATLTDPDRWEPICGGCIAQQVCPMFHNAAALASAVDPTARTRLEHALLLTHLRGHRHITMRDLRSGLAYLITGDAGCADVHQARQDGSAMPATPYWQTAFATETGRDLLLGELQSLDPARYPQPPLERFLYFHRGEGDATTRAALMRDGIDLPPAEDKPRDWLGAWKRRLYFHGVDPAIAPDDTVHAQAVTVDWASLLPYRYAASFIAALEDAQHRSSLLPAIARGISRSDGLRGAALEHGLALRVAHSDANRLTVLKSFAVTDFELAVQHPVAGDLIETLPRALILSHPRSGARLVITLDLFELLMRLANGLEPASLELQPLLEDLTPFKSAVQMTETIDLLLIEGDQRPYLLTQEDRKVVLRDAAR